ncbi:class I SAM-dependent methyltransferase, partial [candidate division KSB1 bacterium]
MQDKSIRSYNSVERVKKYDADMEIMHPNRSKMIEIALEVLPFENSLGFSALELGTGTGYFTYEFMRKFPNVKIISIEGAESMIELARARLGNFTGNADFRIGDFRELDSLIKKTEKVSAVFLHIPCIISTEMKNRV